MASRSSSALLVTLLTLALMTIIVVAVLSSMTWEVQSSRRSYETQKARGLATLALHTAVSQIRTALGKWDNPYGDEQGDFTGAANSVLAGFLTAAPTNYWSISPGIITIWSYKSVAQVTNCPLFSVPSTYPANNGVANLNAQAQDGSYPILGTPTALPVYWVDVMANPTNTPALNNQIIGRYAFWTDDENSKININVADGVINTNFPSTYMGAGTPTEVSLMELTNSAGSPLTFPAATNIVAFARTTGFASAREMLHYAATGAGSAYDLYTNNIFNLTSFSRSPDLNVFGQPKIALIPGSQVNWPYTTTGTTVSINTYMYNMATLQPLKELFPSLSGLSDATVNVGNVFPSISLKDNYYYMVSGTLTPVTYTKLRWPLLFEAEAEGFATYNGNGPSGGAGGLGFNSGFSPWTTGTVIANYLAGRNAATATYTGSTGSITWPEFPGSSTSATNYLSKYTPRQVDSIVMQIVDLVDKDSSPDSGSNYSTTMSAGHITRGWLSGELVSGVGRSPKLDKIEMKYTTAYTLQKGGGTPTTNDIPTLNTQIYLETYFPSRFSGVSLFHEDPVDNGFAVGDFIQNTDVNWQDASGDDGMTNVTLGTSPYFVQNQPALLPKLPSPNTYSTFPTGNGGGSITTTPALTNFSYWGNNLLQTDQGVDWAGNANGYPDADQALAATYHPYLQQTNGTPSITGFGPNATYNGATTNTFTLSNAYLGAGYNNNAPSPILRMNNMLKGSHVAPYYLDIADDYAPGQYRVVENLSVPAAYGSMMSTNAAIVGVVHISGGVAVKFTTDSGHASDADPVPLDAERGSFWPTATITVPGVGSGLASTINGTGGMGGQLGITGDSYFTSPMSTYTNVLQAVIPMAATVSVPLVASFPSPGSTVTIYAAVNQGDILVNKFPGDWTVTTNSPPAGWTMTMPSGSAGADSSLASVTQESSTTLAQMTGDPDAFWLPTIDNNAELPYVYYQSHGLSVPIDAPQMPRTARFPSIGYLNYVRTGIMPDSESGLYNTWHGTPYRLLSFAPSTGTYQQTTSGSSLPYPDWAMLDLFFMPSSLLTYGSPYTNYAGTTTITPYLYTNNIAGQNSTNQFETPMITYSNTNAVNNMYLYGTCGGATSGRINPNGSVVYTTNMFYPTPGITRTVPLQALLHGLVYNQSVTGVTTYGTKDGLGSNDFHYPSLTAGTAVTGTLVAADIANYLTTNQYGVYATNPAPLREPAEICNIPTIAAAAPTVNGYRNDLVRQIVGNLTTQSNTFSIWVEAQSITKAKSNLNNDALTPANYGLYETGDQVTSTVRYHFIVERDLDPGIDGIYGNAANPGPDGIVGTLDDPENTSWPFNNPVAPDYFYKIIYAEEIR